MGTLSFRFGTLFFNYLLDWVLCTLSFRKQLTVNYLLDWVLCTLSFRNTLTVNYLLATIQTP
jgi:hypothetical protein